MENYTGDLSDSDTGKYGYILALQNLKKISPERLHAECSFLLKSETTKIRYFNFKRMCIAAVKLYKKERIGMMKVWFKSMINPVKRGVKEVG